MPFISSMQGNFGPIGRSRRGFNQIIGGTKTTIENYNGTGEIWDIHSWSGGGSQSFVVANSTLDWKLLFLGTGGKGGPDATAGGGGGGSFEGTLEQTQLVPGTYTMSLANGSAQGSSTLIIGSTTLTVNSGGSNYSRSGGSGGGGTSGSLTNLTARTGGTGGAYNAGGGSGGFISNITGASLGYCGGGGAGGHGPNEYFSQLFPGGGGVNGGGNGGAGGNGNYGVGEAGGVGVRGGGGGGSGAYNYSIPQGSNAMLIIAYRVG